MCMIGFVQSNELCNDVSLGFWLPLSPIFDLAVMWILQHLKFRMTGVAIYTLDESKMSKMVLQIQLFVNLLDHLAQ